MTATDLARRDRVFYLTMAIVALVVVLAGFSPSFFLAMFNPESRPLAPIYHVHGAVFTTWMLLHICQAWLIGRGKVATHMKLGQAGAVLGFVVIIFAFVITHHAGVHGLGGPLGTAPDQVQALAVPFFDMFVFAPLFIAGLLLRKKSPEAHKRLMTLATVGGLLGAAIGRAPLFVFEFDRQLYLTLALLFAGPVYDLVTRRRIHLAYVFGLIPPLLLLTDMRLAIGATEQWRQFVAWWVG
ncbi:MAG: hypothetical protein RL026_1850 [Pseudomonadota bacterium]|jgi:cytochrome bd-type quinol oxidase subunit 1